MFQLKRRGTVEYFEAEALASLAGVSHGFCTRLGGVSESPFASLNVGGLVGDRESAVSQNLGTIRAAFAVPAGGLVLMGQVHGDKITVIDGDGCAPNWIPQCDGLVTARPGVALAVKTADCVPILFVDPVRRVIGVAHAGWRSTALGIAGKMVRLLEERFGSARADLRIAIGPAIGQCCYQVDGPVQEAFGARPAAGQWLQPCPEAADRWRLDLAAANGAELADLGIPAGQVVVARQCTACRTDLFFSHRAEQGRTGRQLSLLMLADGPQKKGLDRKRALV